MQATRALIADAAREDNAKCAAGDDASSIARSPRLDRDASIDHLRCCRPRGRWQRGDIDAGVDALLRQMAVRRDQLYTTYGYVFSGAAGRVRSLDGGDGGRGGGGGGSGGGAAASSASPASTPGTPLRGNLQVRG